MKYRRFSPRQTLTLTWWKRPEFADYDGILCDGSIRSGKTVSMAVGFILWSMYSFNNESFAICGRTIESLRRNVIVHLPSWLEGLFKVTERRAENRVGVKLDGTNNPRSKYNAFWFALDEIAIIESEDNFMLNDYITANVQFLDGTNHNMQYSYALYDPTICVSDIVVVKTGHHGFALAKVIEIAPESATAVQFGREIVSKVDFSAYTARQEKAKQLKELKQKMDAKVKVLQSTALYELLAEKDPELASMLTAYKELTKKEDMNHV